MTPVPGLSAPSDSPSRRGERTFVLSFLAVCPFCFGAGDPTEPDGTIDFGVGQLTGRCTRCGVEAKVESASATLVTVDTPRALT